MSSSFYQLLPRHVITICRTPVITIHNLKYYETTTTHFNTITARAGVCVSRVVSTIVTPVLLTTTTTSTTTTSTTTSTTTMIDDDDDVDDDDDDDDDS